MHSSNRHLIKVGSCTLDMFVPPSQTHISAHMIRNASLHAYLPMAPTGFLHRIATFQLDTNSSSKRQPVLDIKTKVLIRKMECLSEQQQPVTMDM